MGSGVFREAVMKEAVKMRYWECKCGNLQAFGSDSPSPCVSCHKCGTNAFKQEPEPHVFRIKYNEDTGEPKYERCIKCSERRPIQTPAIQNDNQGKVRLQNV
jgi:hypothetical protein